MGDHQCQVVRDEPGERPGGEPQHHPEPRRGSHLEGDLRRESEPEERRRDEAEQQVLDLVDAQQVAGAECADGPVDRAPHPDDAEGEHPEPPGRPGTGRPAADHPVGNDQAQDEEPRPRIGAPSPGPGEVGRAAPELDLTTHRPRRSRRLRSGRRGGTRRPAGPRRPRRGSGPRLRASGGRRPGAAPASRAGGSSGARGGSS